MGLPIGRANTTVAPQMASTPSGITKRGKSVHLPVLQSGLGRTLRQDAWWVGPAITFTILTGFIVYATFRAFENAHFTYGPYLSPFYSPLIDTSWAKGWPVPVSGAMLILAGPASFRFTCYYYRKAYYRAFWSSPPACAVAEPHKSYSGETKFPLIFQNLHRYFFAAAVVISLINSYDAIRAFQGKNGGVGIGLGTLIMLANVILLWTYTISCHSCRHIMGGKLRSFSRHPLRYKAWTLISKLNTKHMELAWTTLGTLMLTDGYIALVSSGTFTDLRIVN